MNRTSPSFWLRIVVVLSVAGAAAYSRGAEKGRSVISLDGTWQIDESILPDKRPTSFSHIVPVPGLANLSRPAFRDVDLFDSLELISNRIRSGKLPESARVKTAGIPRQDRDYFWYRRTFLAPPRREVAMLRINKAQFGTAVFLNGEPVGEYSGCFSAGWFDLSRAIRWQGENELVVRVGAHPGVLPVTFPAGTDFEKLKWTPGIYDSVSLLIADNPFIETVQVAPHVGPSELTVQTRLHNYGQEQTVALVQTVRPWKGGGKTFRGEPERVRLAQGETKLVTQTLRVPGARLWTPDDPFLYELVSETGGDSVVTRFGMREFRTDAKTGRALLNGKVCYLRGSNITLHRFFEDPDCGDLPWKEAWVRKLLVEIPKKMNWNAFRFCIGPVPDRWLEIADEAGLLIQNEFFVWTGAPDWDSGYARNWDVPEMVRQYGDWMRDNWNHPSVVIWDANNETRDDKFGARIIPAVRPLDQSNRPWENSYNPPVAPDDPVEYHPYLFQRSASTGRLEFQLSDLETRDPAPKGGSLPKEPHPIIINEYGWTWLNRDGSPTLLTEKLYPLLLGPGTTPEERFALNAYILAGETEFWRASRQYAGVLHFVYLTCSYPGVYTSDHFRDVRTLELEPQFAEYMSEAFKPFGVFVKLFQPELASNSRRETTVVLVNDELKPAKGKLMLSLESRDGKVVSSAERSFAVDALGTQSLEIPLEIPRVAGKFTVRAAAKAAGSRTPTVSRRLVTVTASRAR
jgi:beta-galactosidase